MFKIALIIGVYSYLIFFLGIFGLLHKNIIYFASLLYFVPIIALSVKKLNIDKNITKKLKVSNISKLLIIILFVQALVNFTGVLGPEIGFDALWYHLTLPKLYFLAHRISHIQGGLLYYSDIPKNIEMLYISALSLGGETLAKTTHYLMGILCIIAVYKLSRKFLPSYLSFIACIIFYSNLVVGWESISSYVDLGTTFFTTVSVYEFFNWLDTKKRRFIVFSAIMTGFAISTKLVMVNLLPIFILLIIYQGFVSKIKISKLIGDIMVFLFFSILISLPWFVFSYINTQNPFYPLFDPRFTFSYHNNIFNLINLFVFSSDPLNPTYVIMIPLVILMFRKISYPLRLLTVFSLFGVLFWYQTSQIGGSRFILPFVTAFSVVVVGILASIKDKYLYRYLLAIILSIALTSVLYRFVANAKFIPVVFGKETKEQFLAKNLKFDFGDFYDTDGYFKKNIKSSDMVLLFGFHNLYYIDFPFIDSSWVKGGDKFNYIAIQNANLPARFAGWNKIYTNKLTNVSLYSDGGKVWSY